MTTKLLKEMMTDYLGLLAYSDWLRDEGKEEEAIAFTSAITEERGWSEGNANGGSNGFGDGFGNGYGNGDGNNNSHSNAHRDGDGYGDGNFDIGYGNGAIYAYQKE